jgi:hypothetical protein
MSIYFDVALDPTFTIGSFNISPPVGSDFVNARDAFGILTPITKPFSELIYTVISDDTASNQISIEVEISIAGAAITAVANIQYIII